MNARTFLLLPVILGLLLFVSQVARAAPGQTEHTGDQGDGTYRNPVLPADYSDPDVCRVDDDFYMVASTFESSPGVTVLHSKDLVNWQTIGAAIPDISRLGPSFNWDKMGGYNAGVYAPSIRYHDKKFWVFVNVRNAGFFQSVASKPSGPWTVTQLKDRNGKPMAVRNWTDPCPFWDDDGNAYLATSHPSQRWFSYLFKMTPDGTQLLDADVDVMNKNDGPYPYPDGGTLISPFHSSEGNKLYKRNGYYYLQHIEFLDKGQGAGTYVFRSKNIYGTLPDGSPGKEGNPGKYDVLKFHSSLPGQGGFFDTSKGDWFWIAQFNQHDSDGRCPNLLPVHWIDDWPAVGVDVKSGMGVMAWQSTKPIAGQPIVFPLGDDEFDSPVLSLKWEWNHQPRMDHWSLSEHPGYLRLHAWAPLKKDAFFTAGNTISQRYYRSSKATAVVKLDLAGMADGQRAGLAHFNGGRTYATLDVVQNAGVSSLEYNENGQVLPGPAIPAKTGQLWLRSIVKFDDVNAYAYSFDGTNYTDFGGAYKLSSGNFRGDQIGIFTYNSDGDTGFIDVDYFHYSFANH